jgi:DNA-binding NarL/FixJ family response regulator
VLLDVNLPDVSGLDVARELAARADPPRVLLVSPGSVLAEQLVRESGAVAFLAKDELPGSDLHALLGGGSGVALMSEAPLRVVIGEDHALLRQGLVRLLERDGFEVVAQAGDVPDLLRKAQAHHPDVVIVDVQMPPDRTDDGLPAAVELRELELGIGVLVLLQFLEERYALDLVGENAIGVGYLLKDRVADVSVLIDALRRVAAGGSALDPEVVARMVGRRRRHSPIDELTAREREVLELMAQGKSNQVIAEALFVTRSRRSRSTSRASSPSSTSASSRPSTGG